MNSCKTAGIKRALGTKGFFLYLSLVFSIYHLESRLGIRDSNPNFHVQSVACCRCTNPQYQLVNPAGGIVSRPSSVGKSYLLLRAVRRVLSSISRKINKPLETACKPKK